MPKPIRIAVVEDDKYIRNDLAELIKSASNLELAGTYGDGPSALKGIPLSKPDVVIMDIKLPGVDGVECVHRLKMALPEIGFLMLTAHEDSELLFESLKAGAGGYLLKRTSARKLIESLRELYEGGAPMTPQIARQVVQFISSVSKTPKGSSSELSQLTPGQKAALDELARGYSYKEIADHLNISVDGVRAYIRKIYEKLHVHSRTEAIIKYLGR